MLVCQYSPRKESYSDKSNAVSCILVLSCVQVIDEDGCQALSHELGTYFLLELGKMREEFDIIGDVRGKGLMIGLELVANKVGLISQ